VTPRAWAACGALLALAACGGVPVPPGDGPVAGGALASLDGTRARIDLLARQFLPRAKAAPAGFASYAYLVFGDQAQATGPARKAAGAAFLTLFSDVADASKTAAPEHMALLLAPVRDAASARALTSSPNLERFLLAYDHDRAAVLAARFAQAGKRLPAVALVAYPRPLEGTDAVVLKEAWVIDLTDAGKAEERFLRLREALVVGAKAPEVADGKPLAVRIVLAVFDAIGTAADKLADVKL
jgi:hypothetical protein